MGHQCGVRRDLQKMREAVRHSMDSELFPSSGVEASQVHERVHRDDFWRKNSEVLHLSMDMDVEGMPAEQEGHARAAMEGAHECRETQYRSEMRLSPGVELHGTFLFAGIHGAYGRLFGTGATAFRISQ